MKVHKKEKMKRIIPFTILLMTLAVCTAPQVQALEPAATEMPQAVIQILPRSIANRMGTNSKFAQLPMAAKTEYVFFRKDALAMNGPISGESAIL